MGMNVFLQTLAITGLLIKSGDGLACYQCRSDEIAECGDPFISSRIPRKECDVQYTQSSSLCYKTTQYVQSTGQLVTVRGCSSFDSQTFPVAWQKAMVGDYWESDNVFSICDYAGCNSAKSLQIEVLTALLIFSGIAVTLWLSDPSPIIGYACHSLTHSLTDWLTHSLLFSKLYWCDPGVRRCLLKTCWGCFCCWC